MKLSHDIEHRVVKAITIKEYKIKVFIIEGD